MKVVPLAPSSSPSNIVFHAKTFACRSSVTVNYKPQSDKSDFHNSIANKMSYLRMPHQPAHRHPALGVLTVGEHGRCEELARKRREESFFPSHSSELLAPLAFLNSTCPILLNCDLLRRRTEQEQFSRMQFSVFSYHFRSFEKDIC